MFLLKAMKVMMKMAVALMITKNGVTSQVMQVTSMETMMVASQVTKVASVVTYLVPMKVVSMETMVVASPVPTKVVMRWRAMTWIS
jgi:hypothetical protein